MVGWDEDADNQSVITWEDISYFSQSETGIVITW